MSDKIDIDLWDHRRAFLSVIVRGGLIFDALFVIVLTALWIFGGVSYAELFAAASLLPGLVLLIWLLNRGATQATAILLVAFFFTATAFRFFAVGIDFNGAVMLLMGAVIAALVLGLRWAVAVAILNTVLFVVIQYTTRQGWRPPQSPEAGILSESPLLLLEMLAAVVLISLATNRWAHALRQAHNELAEKALALANANEELSQYNFAASHELKTPLRSIISCVDIIEEELAAKLDISERDYLNGMKNAGRHALQLTEDLLDFSRMGNADLPITPVDIGALIDKLIKEQGINGDCKVVASPTWPTLRTNKTVMRCVLGNLLSNAVKYNRSQPKCVELGWSRDADSNYTFYVRDNGIGIDARHHESIFGVFKRLHPRNEISGSGIGLALVSKALKRIGGSVRVDSTPNEGSTFYVTLPTSAEHPADWGIAPRTEGDESIDALVELAGIDSPQKIGQGALPKKGSKDVKN